MHNALLDVARTMTDSMLLGQEVKIYCLIGCTVEPLYNKQGYLSNEGTAAVPTTNIDVYTMCTYKTTSKFGTLGHKLAYKPQFVHS